jgi:hypothetical protein
MAKRVFVHIGAPKCGTTFLQSVLLGNRERLAADGLLFPGRKIFDHNLVLMALQAPESDAPHPRATSAWQELRAQIRDWSGDAVLTNEWFVRATDEQAARLHRDLAEPEIHVVYTARAYVHQIPAAWQELLKRGLATSLPEFVASLDDDAAKYSWWTLDPVRALARWSEGLPPSHVHVVTVPPKGADPELLWKRFAGVFGLKTDAYDLTTAEPNESLSAEAAALLQRLGPGLRDAIDADRAHWTEQYRWIRRYLSHGLLASVDGSPIGVDVDLATALRARSHAVVEALSATGYDIVGSLDDLLDSERPVGSRDPATVTDAELLDVATHLVAGLFADVREQTRRAEAVEDSPDRKPSKDERVRHDRR